MYRIKSAIALEHSSLVTDSYAAPFLIKKTCFCETNIF